MPKPTIAIIGASPDRSKFGNKAVRAYLRKGYDVYPVNPKGGEIEGLSAYRSLSEVPVASLDRVSVYLPPAVALGVLDEVAAKGCGELWLNPGTDSREVVEKARRLGLPTIQACSIVAIGVSPASLAE
ncbi:MAG: CoA-binding protein [Planctomycetia bacterium]|nr:CoA-binding protein [Planctomycetia bacterium]